MKTARNSKRRGGMSVYLNGEFVPERRAVISVLDRGFLYGDGLFETMRVYSGLPFRWAQHVERLRRGAAYLGIKLPASPGALRRAALDLIARNKMPETLLRLTISRGVGPRGYSPRGADKPTVCMTLHSVPAQADPAPRWKLITSTIRLAANEPLAQLKSCNKLPQILARAQADEAGAQQALLLNTDGWVVEADSANLFWIDAGAVCTAPLASGILPGVTRAVVLELCRKLRLRHKECQTTPKGLLRVEGVFVSLSSMGIVEAASLDGQPLGSSPLTEQLRTAYDELVTSSSRDGGGACGR